MYTDLTQHDLNVAIRYDAKKHLVTFPPSIPHSSYLSVLPSCPDVVPHSDERGRWDVGSAWMLLENMTAWADGSSWFFKKRKEKQPFSQWFPSVFWKLKEKRVFHRARRNPRGTGASDRLWLTAGSAAAVERKSEKPGINHGTSIKQNRRVLLARGGPFLGRGLES